MGTVVTKEEFVKNVMKAIAKRKEEKDRIYYAYTSDLIRDSSTCKRNMSMKNLYSEV